MATLPMIARQARQSRSPPLPLPQPSPQMISTKTPAQIATMREAGAIVGDTLRQLRQLAQPGVRLSELEKAAQAAIVARGGKPTFKGYHGFPGAVCLSVNHEVVHGIPSSRKLQQGDLLKIDCGVTLGGLVGDAAITVVVGEVSPALRGLVQATHDALLAGIAAARVGGHLGDIGAAIEHTAVALGYGVVSAYCGHGVGQVLHEDPQVPNLGPAGAGPLLLEGWCLALEPLLTLGNSAVHTQSDGWTVVTSDGKPSAHFEHSIALLRDGPQILTLTSSGEHP